MSASYHVDQALYCNHPGRSEDSLKGDTFVLSFACQTFETMDPKKLELSRSLMLRERKGWSLAPARRQVCLLGRDFTDLWQLVTSSCLRDRSQWWAGPHGDWDSSGWQTSWPLFKLKSYIRTLKMDKKLGRGFWTVLFVSLSNLISK